MNGFADAVDRRDLMPGRLEGSRQVGETDRRHRILPERRHVCQGRAPDERDLQRSRGARAMQ